MSTTIGNGTIIFGDGTTQSTAARIGYSSANASFGANTTWTVPTGIYSCKVTVVGGGGDGGAYINNSGGGGGGGGVAISYVSTTPGTTHTISFIPRGTSGANAYFDTILATGGSVGASNSGAQANGGIGIGGMINYSGTRGGASGPTNSGQALAGGSTGFGSIGYGGSGATATTAATVGSSAAVIIEY